ncbi:hypothetical protein [Streptomyces sp. L2]|uniref:hypothetical protein n=1 Tax=Streptomyces sp. L2 TaxID=2162665 RepID=UPI001012E808|nr:hypothetical protein [Streptomyces sp. L2]
MGSLRLTLCTGLLVAAALTPAAYAADAGRDVSVTPASPAPGADVTLQVRGCSGRQGTAASAVFVSDARLTGTQGTLAGDTRVRSTARPGAYDVQITCADYVIKGKITVVAKAARGNSGHSTVPAPAAPTVPSAPSAAPASPVAPVDAGGGGAYFATVDTSSTGPGTGQAVTGLVLAAVAAVSVALLGARRRRNGTH